MKFLVMVALLPCLAAFSLQGICVKKGLTNNRIQMATIDSLDLSAQPVAEEWLSVCEPGLRKATLGMFRACKEIAYKIRTASCDKMACFNEFGDEQLAIDILANNVIFQNLKNSGAVATASSEETPTEGIIILLTISFCCCRFS